MARDFFDAFACSRAVFEEAGEAGDCDLARICFEDTERLGRTEYQQAAILTAELAMLAALRQQSGREASFFAGHSLGEYTALVAAGAVGLADAVRLVRLRGRLMQEAGGDRPGAMTAIIHRDLDVEALAAVAARFGVDVANHNALDQAVLSGLADEVAAAVAALKADPALRVRAIALNVSAPFHSRYMEEVEEPLRRALEAVPSMAAERATHVASNVTGSLHTGSRLDLERRLAEQVRATVRWVDDMRELLDRDCEVVEIGPGRPLRGFFASLGVEIRSITTVATLEAWLGGQRR